MTIKYEDWIVLLLYYLQNATIKHIIETLMIVNGENMYLKKKKFLISYSKECSFLESYK